MTLASIIILISLGAIPVSLIIFFMKMTIEAGFSIYKDLVDQVVVKAKQIEKNLWEKQIEDILRNKR